jgi:glycosyltransferase involved in cell wall biosynthesis
LKTAYIQEWLIDLAGSEQVLRYMMEVFDGDIFTLVQSKEKLKNTFFEDKNITTSLIQKLPFAEKKYQNYLLFFPFAIEQFDLSDYDVVISSSHAVAKGVITKTDQLHICYCHTPMRYAWDMYHEYLKGSGLDEGLKGFIAKLILHYIRIWDYSTANRPDYFVANSRYIAKRIKKIYNRDAEVIHPPVDTDKFEYSSLKDDYYVTASRLVPYKRIDLIVRAFSKMKDKKLVVIGQGGEMEKIKKIATPNIELLGYQPFEEMKRYIQKAKAFVFAAEEDFGIVPVEAQACGTPVIAYGKGGVLDSVKENETGIFFKEQKSDSIIAAVKKFEKIENTFDLNVVRRNAEAFSIDNFKQKFKKFIDSKRLSQL